MSSTTGGNKASTARDNGCRPAVAPTLSDGTACVVRSVSETRELTSSPKERGSSVTTSTPDSQSIAVALPCRGERTSWPSGADWDSGGCPSSKLTSLGVAGAAVLSATSETSGASGVVTSVGSSVPHL